MIITTLLERASWLLCGRVFVLLCTNHNPSSVAKDDDDDDGREAKEKKNLVFSSLLLLLLVEIRKEGERERNDDGGRILLFSSRPFLCCAVAHNNLPTFPPYWPQTAHFLFDFVLLTSRSRRSFECSPARAILTGLSGRKIWCEKKNSKIKTKEDESEKKSRFVSKR